MTDKVKHSTSYFHEAIAHAFEMFKSGYEPVMETPFQPRRLGSAFVTEYKPVRESFDDFDEYSEEEEEILRQAYIKIGENRLKSSSSVEEACKKILYVAFENLDLDENCNHIDRKAVEELNQLTIQQKWEAEEALNELAAQSQELGMYEKDNGIFDRLVESIESAENNPEGCVSTIVEVDKEQVRVYSKEELEDMEWSEFKKLIDAAGIRGRRRQNLTRDYLIYQEENLK